MTVITDMANAIGSYPQDEVAISITDVDIHTGVGPAINVDEVWKFKVNVTNNGHLNMTQVSLHVRGLNDVLVSKTAVGGFVSGFYSDDAGLLIDIDGGGQSTKTDYFYFKPTDDTDNTVMDLVTAHIYDWYGNFQHFFTNHTPGGDDHPSTPSGTARGIVSPA
jgi:hypothetical protein